MRPRSLQHAKQNHRKTFLRGCCLPGVSEQDDVELELLFHKLALSLFELMGPDDAEILALFEMHGQTLSEISAQSGCSRTEATRHLKRAQRSFCQLVVLALAPVKPE